MMKRSLVFLALVGWMLPQAVAAQNVSARAAQEALRPEARALVRPTDPTLEFRTRAVARGRLDVDDGVLRAAYRIGTRLAPEARPDVAARAYLRLAAPAFGWAPAALDLEPVAVEEGRYATHLVFQQTLAGLPVFKRQVKVSLDRENQPTMVISGYAPHLAAERSFDPRPTLGAAEAEARAGALVSAQGAETSAAELGVYASKPARLAWRVIAWPADAVAEWEVMLDAHTGEVLHLVDQSTHAHGVKSDGETEKGRAGEARFEASATPTAAVSRRVAGERSTKSQILGSRRANGSGLVFDPDPLTTAGVEYGGAYVDADDADVEVLNAERIEVPLLDITQGSDGLYRLEGPYVFIDGSSQIGGTAYAPPAEPDPNGFRYGRSNLHFEAVMVYYHIDKSQRYLQSLDLGRAVQAVPIHANPHGLGNADESKFIPSRNVLIFGDGGIDDGEDADVILHEYGHALLEGASPGLLNTNEGRALHEGWADYWAASYSRGLVDIGKVPNHDWLKVFTWDGNATWQGRRLDRAGIYPDDFLGRSVHLDGALWAATLMEIYGDVGQAILDRLTLASHAYLGPPVTFVDAAEALIQADFDLYGGAHAGALVARLGARGFIDPADYGPAVTHEPVVFVEEAGSAVRFEVQANPVTAPLSQVAIVYSVNGGAFETLALTPEGEARYGGALMLPAGTTEVRYYVEARDDAGHETRLPAGAPDQTYRFEVGADVEAPEIDHEPRATAALQAWPVSIIAQVRDNQGVDSVWVSYAIDAPDGSLRAEGAFGLTAGTEQYTGAFDVGAEVLEEGTTVRYRIHARDVAAVPNENVTEEFLFQIVIEGVLAIYTFESPQGVLGTGVWERGEPAFGLEVAHAGRNVWGTSLGEAYPAFEQVSTLELLPVNLAGVEQAFLVFWHWHDFEHSGLVTPEGASGSSLWDGGNVKIAAEGGDFEVAEPLGGYTGLIEEGTGNPLENEPGFGGYSFGWRRVVVPLPAQNDLRIRFDFGTDSSNDTESVFYAGWFIDDVRITTELTPDTAPPMFLATPPTLQEVDAGQPLPPFVIEAQDDVGIADAFVQYDILRGDGSRQTSFLRLAMDPTDPARFVGELDGIDEPFGAADRVEYRLRLVDFDGNETLFPEAGTAPLIVRFRLAESLGVLAGLQPTGLWRGSGSTWSIRATSDAPDAATSSLVLQPLDLPSNVETITFKLLHTYDLGAGLGGNVKLSADGGATWSLIAPAGGYGASFDGAGHPMAGEGVFNGLELDLALATFDLTAYAGQQIRLRLDFAAARPPEGAEFWRIEDATVGYATSDDGFEVPRTLALHPNFPDPFGEQTTLSYTLDEAMPVRMELYNMLGQRITVLVDATQEAGTYTLSLSRGGLAGGVYLLRMIAGEQQLVETLTIAR